MATNVDIGCESGGGVGLQSFFEAVKKVGTAAVFRAYYNFIANITEPMIAVAFRQGSRYYGTIAYAWYDSTGDYPLSIYTQSAGNFRYSIVSAETPSGGRYELRLTASDRNVDLDQQDIEFYYLTANTYDQLMSQLGGGIKPYHILSPIKILEVREYGKQCRYWL